MGFVLLSLQFVYEHTATHTANFAYGDLQKPTNFFIRLQHVERRMLEGLMGHGVKKKKMLAKANISTEQQRSSPDCRCI